MTEAELNSPKVQQHRRRLDLAKLALAGVAAVAATTAAIIATVLLVQLGSVTETVKDCTAPAGKCYAEQQQRNADNRARLVDADVAVEVCSWRPAIRAAGTSTALHQCVNEVLEQQPR